MTARAFWALRVAKSYNLRCKRSRERECDSPRSCGGRGCDGGRKATTTGGGGVGLSRRKVLQGWPGTLAGVDRLRGLLWRWQRGQGGAGLTGGE
jgi:hypothetical protein